MKPIPLTQNKFAIVDDWNYEWLNQWKWCAHRHKRKGQDIYYALRHTKRVNGIQGTVYMHRLIMNTPDGMEVDHIDHNGLNCREYNMRNSTIKQNRRNKRASGKSKYIGVDITKRGYIRASIKVENKSFYLGTFETEELAAKARDVASKEYFREFANLNFKP